MMHQRNIYISIQNSTVDLSWKLQGLFKQLTKYQAISLQVPSLKTKQKKISRKYNINSISIMQQQVTGEDHPKPSEASPSILRNSQAKRSFHTRKKRWQIKEFVRQLTSKDRWNISNGNFSPHDLEQILKNAEDPQQLTCLWLHWNSCPSIISLIAVHIYPNLKIINIGGNGIESIEQLQGISFINLQQLWIWNNRILNIDSLRKCNLPRLKRIDASDNLLLQLPKLYELHAPLLENINVERNSISTLTHFVKNIYQPPRFQLLFMQNNLVKALDKPISKGKIKVNQITQMKGQPLKYN